MKNVDTSLIQKSHILKYDLPYIIRLSVFQLTHNICDKLDNVLFFVLIKYMLCPAVLTAMTYFTTNKMFLELLLFVDINKISQLAHFQLITILSLQVKHD